MKLEHLIQAYDFNEIQIERNRQIYEQDERSGVIEFHKGIAASYLLDKDDTVIEMKMFFNCLTLENRTLENQLSHVIRVINIIQNTTMLLSNITQKECNMIINQLGLYDNTFKQSKQIKHLEHAYKIEVISGMLCFTIKELKKEAPL